MKIVVNQLKDNYKKDLIRLMIYDLKSDKWFIAFILIYVLIFIIDFLNKIEIISFRPDTFRMLSFTLGFGLLAMLIYTVIQVLKIIKKINSEVNNLYENEMIIKLTDEAVSIQTNRYNDSYYLKWNEIKELIVLGNTLFLILVYKNGFMIRINKEEIIRGDFEEVLKYIKAKFKK